MTDITQRINELTNARKPAPTAPTAPTTPADPGFAAALAKVAKARWGAAIEADRKANLCCCAGEKLAERAAEPAVPFRNMYDMSCLDNNETATATRFTSGVAENGDAHTKVTLDSTKPGTAILVISTKNPELVESLEQFAAGFAKLPGVETVGDEFVSNEPAATPVEKAVEKAPHRIHPVSKRPVAEIPKALRPPSIAFPYTSKEVFTDIKWGVGNRYLQAVARAAKYVLASPKLVENIRVALQEKSEYANKITTRQAQWLIAVTFLLALATDATTTDLVKFGETLGLENATTDTVSGFLRRLIDNGFLLEAPVKHKQQITVNDAPATTQLISTVITQYRDNN